MTQDSKKFINRYALLYGGINVGKYPYVTHFRISIYGQALKNLLRQFRNSVYAIPHVGDSTRHLARVIYALVQHTNLSVENLENWLQEQHISGTLIKDIFANFLLSESKRGDKEKIKSYIKACQNFDPQFKILMDLIIEKEKFEVKFVYDSLFVDFDAWEGESDYEKNLPEIIENANKLNLLETNDYGQLIPIATDDDKFYAPPVMLKTFDGMYTFQSSHLAIVMGLAAKDTFNKLIICCDRRYTMQFTHVFRAAKKLGVIVDCAYYGLGLILNKDGKTYKDENGSRLPAVKFIDMLYGQAKQQYSASTKKLLGIKVKDDTYLKAIVISIFKLYDLQQSYKKDYRFNVGEFLISEGIKEANIIEMFLELSSMYRDNDKKKSIREEKINQSFITQLTKHKVALERSKKSFEFVHIVNYLLELSDLYFSFEFAQRSSLPIKIIKDLYKSINSMLKILGIPNDIIEGSNIKKTDNLQELAIAFH